MAQTRSPAPSPRQTNPHARPTRASRSWTPGETAPAPVLATPSPRSTVARAHVDWADSKGLNEWERKALELAEEASQLG